MKVHANTCQRDMHLPAWLMYPFVKLGALIFGGFHLEESSAITAVKNAKIPILIIHGEDDRFVPCRMSRKLAEVCASSCTLFTVPGAGHGLAYMIDPKGYEEAIYRFLKSVPVLADKIKGIPIRDDT